MLKIEVYVDAYYVGSITDRKSTSGYFACSWMKIWWLGEETKCCCNTKIEFRIMALGVCELLWLRIILNDLKVTCEESMITYYDNKSATNIVHNPTHHDKTKHIKIDWHFIKEKLDSDIIITFYVPYRLWLTNMFTKRSSH